MMPGIRFPTFRLIIPAFVLGSQVYLFIRVRKVVLSSGISSRLKSPAVVLAGVAIGLLFAMNGYVLTRPFPWVDPSIAARVVLCYLPAVWAVGSIFSAFLLCLSQLSGGLKDGLSISRSEAFPPGRYLSPPPAASRGCRTRYSAFFAFRVW